MVGEEGRVGDGGGGDQIYGKGGAEGFYMQATPYNWAVGGFIDREEALRMLEGKATGTFVIR